MAQLMAANEASPEAFAQLDLQPSSRHAGARAAAETASETPAKLDLRQFATSAAGEGLTIAFTFCTDTLPYLQVWHDFRKHAGALGIEPCISSKRDGLEKIMQPAESRRYEVNVCFKSGQ
jgi:hypothetical protein